MTKHWDQEMCAGCEYLRKYGSPENFILEDHKKEIGQEPARIQCIECGAKFSRRIGPRTFEIECPKCGGFDTEVA